MNRRIIMYFNFNNFINAKKDWRGERGRRVERETRSETEYNKII